MSPTSTTATATQHATRGCSRAAMENAFTRHGRAVSSRSFSFLFFNFLTRNFLFFADGEPDCADKSDEANCTTTSDTTSKKTPINFDSTNCQDWMFKCSNNKCIPYWWKCDSVRKVACDFQVNLSRKFSFFEGERLRRWK